MKADGPFISLGDLSAFLFATQEPSLPVSPEKHMAGGCSSNTSGFATIFAVEE